MFFLEKKKQQQQPANQLFTIHIKYEAVKYVVRDEPTANGDESGIVSVEHLFGRHKLPQKFQILVFPLAKCHLKPS